MSDATINQYDGHFGEMNGETVDFTNANNISGNDLAGEPTDPWTFVKAIVDLFRQLEPLDLDPRDARSFEELMVSVFVHKFHLMVEKQRGYGTKNIQQNQDTVKALRGILTRATDKLERAKNILGDPDAKLAQVAELVSNLPDDANEIEMSFAIKAIHETITPQEHAGESLKDTLLDSGNYGDIMYMVFLEAWGKQLEENLG
jgi:hypothetical protein